jgi:hypothetical protein
VCSKSIWNIVLLALSTTIYAAETNSPLAVKHSWKLLESPHFRVFTLGQPERAALAIQLLEQYRSFLSEGPLGRYLPREPLTVVAFLDEHSYAPYRENPLAIGEYWPSKSNDYITLQTLDTAVGFRTALHEFTHAVVARMLPRPPSWIDEGLAESYSYVQQEPVQWLFGPSSRHVTTSALQQLSLRWLLTTSATSLTSREEANRFYYGSWGFVHMLMLNPMFSHQFTELLESLVQYTDSEQAVTTTFRVPLSRLQLIFDEYLSDGIFLPEIYNKPWPALGSISIQADSSPKSIDRCLQELRGICYRSDLSPSLDAIR